MQTRTIALIVDDTTIRHTVSASLSEAGYATLELDTRMLGISGATNGADAMCISIADAAGLDRLGQITSADPDLPVIVVTEEKEIAVRAVQQGAYDCMTQSVQPAVFHTVVARAVERRRLANEVNRLRSQLAHYEGEEVLPLRDLERRAIERALRATNGSVTKAAKLLGIGRATLYRRLSSPEMADLRALRGSSEADAPAAATSSSMSSMSQAALAREPR